MQNLYLLKRNENLLYLVHVQNFLGKNVVTHTLVLYLFFVRLFVISIVYWPPRTLEWLILRGENCWAIKTQEARFSSFFLYFEIRFCILYCYILWSQMPILHVLLPGLSFLERSTNVCVPSLLPSIIWFWNSLDTQIECVACLPPRLALISCYI